MWLFVVDLFHASQCSQGSFMSCECWNSVSFRSKTVFFFFPRIVFSSQKHKVKAEMAYLATRSSIPRTYVRMWVVGVCPCNPRAGEVESGGPGVHWPASVTKLSSSRPMKDPITKRGTLYSGQSGCYTTMRTTIGVSITYITDRHRGVGLYSPCTRRVGRQEGLQSSRAS